MATVRKFSNDQIALMEIEYNAGLNSVSMKKFGIRIRDLSERADVPESDVKTWINNRKRKEPPTCFSANRIEEDQINLNKKPLKAPPLQRRPSGYNLFSGNLFATELRGIPNTEKNAIASQNWKDMGEEDKEEWNKRAKEHSKPSLEDLSEIQKKRLVDASLHRIDLEMQNLSQYGGRGIAILLRPYDNKMVMSATTGDESFLLANREILKQFSSFTASEELPVDITVKSIQSLLNEKYRKCYDRVNVEYSKFGEKFHGEGWPEEIPFRQPSKLGCGQRKKIWDCREIIKFVPNQATLCASRDKLPEVEDETEIPEEFEEQSLATTKKIERAMAKSFVAKGDVIPVLAPEKDHSKFWLFLCAGKCKNNGIVNGKWLDRIGETREYRTLSIKSSTRENCVLWNKGKEYREVLSTESFELKDIPNGIFKISHATQSLLDTLADAQVQTAENSEL